MLTACKGLRGPQRGPLVLTLSLGLSSAKWLYRRAIAAGVVVFSVAALLTVTGRAQGVLNGSFEASSSSLTSWTTTGSVSISGTTLTAPASGSRQALIVAPVGGSPGVAATALSTFFGGVALPATARGAATFGSGIKQTFTLTQAATLTFSYKYVTAEIVNSGYDSSFFFKDGAITTLASSTSAGLSSSKGVTGYTNGLNYVSVTVSLGIGAHTIGFGVYNSADVAVQSAIFVDNIYTISAIPEPAASTFIGAMSVVGLAVWRARRREGAARKIG